MQAVSRRSNPNTVCDSRRAVEALALREELAALRAAAGCEEAAALRDELAGLRAELLRLADEIRRLQSTPKVVRALSSS